MTLLPSYFLEGRIDAESRLRKEDAVARRALHHETDRITLPRRRPGALLPQRRPFRTRRQTPFPLEDGPRRVIHIVIVLELQLIVRSPLAAPIIRLFRRTLLRHQIMDRTVDAPRLRCPGIPALAGLPVRARLVHGMPFRRDSAGLRPSLSRSRPRGSLPPSAAHDLRSFGLFCRFVLARASSARPNRQKRG